MTFHIVCVHIIISSVSVAGWPRFGGRSVDHNVLFAFDYL